MKFRRAREVMIKMADEKMWHGGKGKLLEVAGVIAIVYGIINYLMTNLSWPTYGAWIAGGVILVLVGWAKKAMMK